MITRKSESSEKPVISISGDLILVPSNVVKFQKDKIDFYKYDESAYTLAEYVLFKFEEIEKKIK